MPDSATIGEIGERQKLYYGWMILNIVKWHKPIISENVVWGVMTTLA